MATSSTKTTAIVDGHLSQNRYKSIFCQEDASLLELVGGGLLRSNGGWGQLKLHPRARLQHKSDKQVMGDA